MICMLFWFLIFGGLAFIDGFRILVNLIHFLFPHYKIGPWLMFNRHLVRLISMFFLNADSNHKIIQRQSPFLMLECHAKIFPRFGKFVHYGHDQKLLGKLHLSISQSMLKIDNLMSRFSYRSILNHSIPHELGNRILFEPLLFSIIFLDQLNPQRLSSVRIETIDIEERI